MTVGGMQIFPVPRDSTASLFRYVVLDDDGEPDNISGGSTVLFHASTVDGVAVTVNGVGAYGIDGSDGELTYELTAAEVGEVRDLYCEFEVQGLPSGDLVTDMFIMRINRRAKVV